MRRHPFFYRQAPSGRITAVYHHTSEEKRVLGSKRYLASMHQHVLGRRPRGRDADWQAQETDAVGKATTTYTLRGGRGLLRPSQVVYKQQRYRASLAVPQGFSRDPGPPAPWPTADMAT